MVALVEHQELSCTKKPKKGKIILNEGYLDYENAKLESPMLSVWVKIDLPKPLSIRRAQYLRNLGVREMKIGTEENQTLIAQISKGDVNRLAHRPWVEYIIPSQKLHHLG